MKTFNMLDANCLDLIFEFAGIWKHRFYIDVLPKIDQGWMEVGNGYGYGPGGVYEPCGNCYMHINFHSEDNRFCDQCSYMDEIATSFVNFEIMKKKSLMFRYFDNFEAFKIYRDGRASIIRVNKEILKGSTFREIQMLNLV